MKATLQMRLGQHLTLTPQLQQAIHLLQLSSLELELEVREALEENPLLERLEENNNVGSADGDNTNNERENVISADNMLELQREVIPNNLPVDSAWEDIYPETFSKKPLNEAWSSNYNQATTLLDLHAYLQWQLEMMSLSATDQAIGLAIVDAISDHGYLTTSLENLKKGVAVGNEASLGEFATMLEQIQHFNPPGVGARSIQECLLLQLRELPQQTLWLESAKKVLREHMDLLLKHEYKPLMRKCRLNEQAMTGVLDLIHSLEPYPGNACAKDDTAYIVPDIVVKKEGACWKVELNSDATPRLRVNKEYLSILNGKPNANDTQFIKSHAQEARWFIKSLQSRNDTLLKVATCIVERQQKFLEFGEEAMQPLVLHDVAEAIDMHESTISRVTTNKYMHTPRGIYELKYFFSSHVGMQDGGECSSTAIRALIKKIIAAENPRKPLSDNKIAIFLKAQGVNVARRTIAKYRESMAIPPSNERKYTL